MHSRWIDSSTRAGHRDGARRRWNLGTTSFVAAILVTPAWTCAPFTGVGGLADAPGQRDEPVAENAGH